MPKKVSSFTEKKLKEVNTGILQDAEGSSKGFGRYEFTVKERAQIGKYAAEHGPAKAVHHCSKVLKFNLVLWQIDLPN